MLRASGRIFLEASPEGLDPEQIGRALVGQPGVAEVHDLHVWEITSGFPALTAHVLVDSDADCHALRAAVARCCETRFSIDHTTLQVDHAHDDAPLRIQTSGTVTAPRGGDREGS